MISLRGSCTNKSLWLAAVGSFVLILGVGVVLAARLDTITICHRGQTITVSQNSIPAHAAHGDSPGACDQVCDCPFIFDPVTCASNGKTYLNLCIAQCDGATGCVRGGGDLCACPAIWDPVVCGSGIVYANICLATCAGCTSVPHLCVCPLIFAPVTCSDGVTYVNQCTADCLGATGCGGCACPLTIDPVHCTSNNTTYSNRCQADCAGASGCDRICDCPLIWDPVICSADEIYANTCVARCQGAICPEPPGCPCPLIFDPVTCSSDGQTYANQCTADCNGASECARYCNCTLENDPVTCSDGITYANQCVANCNGASGCSRCEIPVCACEAIFDPAFCTSNGVTYVNLCHAQCDRDEMCRAPTGCTRFSTCGCPTFYDPVTCSDGHTYPNQCVATCAGATGCFPPCTDCPEVPPDFGTSVLCTTGNTYPNQCKGICAGEQCYYSDNAVICDPNAGCSGGGLFAPVICPNGASYVNADLATCCLHGATDGCRDGACLFTCPSTANPVTCANGKTYKNSCFATCDGATGCAP